MTDKITREVVEKLFADIRKENEINLDGPLLWGYYFNDTKPEKLEAAAEALEAMGYEFVAIYSDEEETDFALHVEKMDTHTVDSLLALNEKFYAFAAEHGLQAYDGMDVGEEGDEDEEE